MVLRLLGLERLLDVSTISRCLNNLDETSVRNVQRLSETLVLERLSTCYPLY